MALLDEAGQADLEIDLFAPNDTAGLAEMAAVFADQAQAAGITVNVQVLDGGVLGRRVLKRTFATDFWGTRTFLAQVAAGSLPTRSYPETHWPPAGCDVHRGLQRRRSPRSTRERNVITDKMQTELYEEGGLIIPFFQNLLDGYHERCRVWSSGPTCSTSTTTAAATQTSGSPS